ncbi:MAG: nuclear transport factor 2 family protein [Chloroflexota bacterium]
MTIAYADAHDLLERLVAARVDHSGDAFTALFTPEAEVALDPFATPLTGHNALRAYLNDAAGAERGYELVIERHWVSGDTVLAAWHANWSRPSDEAKVRQAGFLSAEGGGDRRITRLRLWTVTREHLAG